jgi:uncharacterized membrane protein
LDHEEGAEREHGQSDSAGREPRDVRRSDGQPQPIESNDLDRREVTEVVSSDEADSGDEEGVLEFAASYRGPLPHAGQLDAYNQIVPGSAKQLIDIHVYEKKASADALTRLTRAESFGVSLGSITSFLLIIGGIAAAVVLALFDKPLAAVLVGIVPAAGGSVAAVISAVKGNGNQQVPVASD